MPGLPHNPSRWLPSSRFLSLEECQRLPTVSTAHDRIIIRLFMLCGLRPSDLFTLRVNDVLPGELRIDETIVLYPVTDHAKTDLRARVRTCLWRPLSSRSCRAISKRRA